MNRIQLSVLLAGLCSKAFGGWYECYNFKGAIDKYPITLSFQVRDGFFGEADRKNHNVLGTYKYDRVNTPLYLEGSFDRVTKKIRLEEAPMGFPMETANRKGPATAAFDFSFSRSGSDGQWTDLKTKKVLTLHLDFVSQMIDTVSMYQDSTVKFPAPVEILMRASTPDKYFVGVYDLDIPKNHYDRAALTSLRIYDKKNNKLFQEIPFPPQAGNAMTIVYENVSTGKNKIGVEFDIGKGGATVDYIFNARRKRYVVSHDGDDLLDGFYGQTGQE